MKGIMEESLAMWELNGIPQAPLLCTGQDEEALLTGHLITAGLADSPARIHSILCRDGVWRVSADRSRDAAGSTLERLEILQANPSDRKTTWQELARLCDEVMALDNSAGLHAVLLSDGEKTVVGRDVGRHNALDKAVGKAAMAGLRLSRAALCSSGRLSLEMFAKAVLAGIPILATRKQVGSLCVAWAEKLNIAVCRVGSEPVCYSAAWRVE